MFCTAVHCMPQPAKPADLGTEFKTKHWRSHMAAAHAAACADLGVSPLQSFCSIMPWADPGEVEALTSARLVPFHACPSTLQALSVGAKIWGAVAEIHPKELIISLPHGLRGRAQLREVRP